MANLRTNRIACERRQAAVERVRVSSWACRQMSACGCTRWWRGCGVRTAVGRATPTSSASSITSVSCSSIASGRCLCSTEACRYSNDAPWSVGLITEPIWIVTLSPTVAHQDKEASGFSVLHVFHTSKQITDLLKSILLSILFKTLNRMRYLKNIDLFQHDIFYLVYCIMLSYSKKTVFNYVASPIYHLCNVHDILYLKWKIRLDSIVVRSVPCTIVTDYRKWETHYSHDDCISSHQHASLGALRRRPGGRLERRPRAERSGTRGSCSVTSWSSVLWTPCSEHSRPSTLQPPRSRRNATCLSYHRCASMIKSENDDSSLYSVPARPISEGAAPCPYWLVPCPIYLRPARIKKKIIIIIKKI